MILLRVVACPGYFMLFRQYTIVVDHRIADDTHSSGRCCHRNLRVDTRGDEEDEGEAELESGDLGCWMFT